MAFGRAAARRQLADENEREDARVSRVLHGVRDELERQKTEVVDGQAGSIARVDGDADAADGHVKTDEGQIFTTFQMSEIVDECVDWFTGVLNAPQPSTRLASDVFGYELLRQTVNLPYNSTA